ncbi:unnamed protein product [Diamesa hyperborea]
MNSQQEINSRKILENLNFKKQQLEKGINPASTPLSLNQPKEPVINLSARATYTTAQTTSFGYFVETDSSFGNSILPVLPRFND